MDIYRIRINNCRLIKAAGKLLIGADLIKSAKHGLAECSRADYCLCAGSSGKFVNPAAFRIITNPIQIPCETDW